MLAWNLSQQTGHTRETVCHDLRVEGMHPYCILTLQELQPPEFGKCCNFCAWFKGQFGEDVEEQPIIFFTDEAWFHLSGYVNSKNYRISCVNNSHVFQQTSLHPQKVGVWCAVPNYCVIGPIFHRQTLTSEEYQCIYTDFIALLNNTRKERIGWFQQDNAKAHTSDWSMTFIHKVFEERVFPVGLWPLRSPDQVQRMFFYQSS